NPFFNRALNAGVANRPGLDFGNKGITVIGQLMVGFASLWLFAILMKSMIHKIPEISSSIAGIITSLGSIDTTPFKQRVQESVSDLKLGAGAAVGGVMGGELGAMIGKREGGGLFGGLIGAMVSRR